LGLKEHTTLAIFASLSLLGAGAAFFGLHRFAHFHRFHRFTTATAATHFTFTSTCFSQSIFKLKILVFLLIFPVNFLYKIVPSTHYSIK